MTANEYQNAAMRTAGSKNPMDLLVNGVLGLAGESGECADIVKKHLFHDHELDREHLIKELGDVAWYLAITSNALGCTLDDVLQQNVDKLIARYPEGFDPERSKHRDENDI